MLIRCLPLAVVPLVLVSPLAAAETAPTEKEVREAILKALPLLEKGALGHMKQRTCFACHNQALPILAMTTARSRGIAINEKDLEKHLQFINGFLDRNRTNYLKGKGQGGQVDTAGYALWTLEMGGWKANETTAAVTEYLLLYNKDLEHWRVTANRPPSEASQFTANYLALRALQTYGTPEQKERIAARTRVVRGWLAKAPAKDTEDRVFRLWAMQRAGFETKELEAAAQDLLKTQCEDGGWAQTVTLQSDAYATGTALVVLHQAGGLATSDAVYRRGLQFLLKTQLPDGSWRVRSRSKPFQTYFESGFPHGKDQFISIAASSWATTALALSLPAVKPDQKSGVRGQEAGIKGMIASRRGAQPEARLRLSPP